MSHILFFLNEKSHSVFTYFNKNCWTRRYSIIDYYPKYPDKNIKDVEYQNEIKNKLVVLESFLEQIYAKNINQDLQYVDLRFSNQVVVKYK